ncbi:uncharacterized protein I303_101406 [Kwoniella dejecticola CBS 10117]|uniref:Uncharacterized protein n=1 Tax=Kwoniella dejecticola CBS 10117 TaxID=1296121 RepID=A0A1A6AHR6_9TREE|nr:uncharacterized protein I303_01415 [Kwoniella dejecticola CBS 10117]OBR89586.1 hypothetical protein I303_01415 [Kwoniella dejecticola CBS 10117]
MSTDPSCPDKTSTSSASSLDLLINNSMDEQPRSTTQTSDAVMSHLRDVPSDNSLDGRSEKLRQYKRNCIIELSEEALKQIAIKKAELVASKYDALKNDGLFHKLAQDDILQNPLVKSKVSSAIAESIEGLNEDDLREYYVAQAGYEEARGWTNESLWEELGNSCIAVQSTGSSSVKCEIGAADEHGDDFQISFGPFNSANGNMKTPIHVADIRFLQDGIVQEAIAIASGVA